MFLLLYHLYWKQIPCYNCTKVLMQTVMELVIQLWC